jgi:hypothetical protein
MTVVIGCDPGGTTGLAVVEYTEAEGYQLCAHIGYAVNATGVVAALEAMAEEHAPAGLAGAYWIAAERFVVSRRAGRSGTAAAGERARNILGALEAAFPGRVKLATASRAKGWATDARLEAAGLRPTQGRPHTTDACRHALYMLVTTFGHPDPLGGAYRRARADGHE